VAKKGKGVETGDETLINILLQQRPKSQDPSILLSNKKTLSSWQGLQDNPKELWLFAIQRWQAL
jgi:hypothetical protein